MNEPTCWMCGEVTETGALCDFCAADMASVCSMCGKQLELGEVVRCGVCEKNLVELLSK